MAGRAERLRAGFIRLAGQVRELVTSTRNRTSDARSAAHSAAYSAAYSAALVTLLACLVAACGRSISEPKADDPGASPAIADPSENSIDDGPAAPAPPRLADLADRGLDPAAVESIQAALDAVEASPEDAAAWLELGMAYQANEIFPEALESYAQAGALAPAEARPPYYRALIFGQLGQPEAALEAMREAAALEPGFAALHWRLGLLLLEAGQADAARPAFEAALALEAENEAAWIGLGRVALQAGQHEEAAARFEHARDLKEGNAGYASRLLGTALQRMGQKEAARLALAGAGEASPLWSDPWQADLNDFRDSFGFRSRAAEKLLSEGKTAQGVGLLETLRREQPDRDSILINLGAGYGALGRFGEAAEVLEAYLARHPQHAPSRENLARAHLGLMQQPGEDRGARWQAALDQVNQAIEIAPQRATAYGLRADIMFLADRFEEAADDYARAGERAGREPRWAAAEGRMRLRLEDWSRMVELLEEVTRRAPEQAEAWRNLGIARARLGQSEAARAALERALELDPGDAEARSELNALGRP